MGGALSAKCVFLGLQNSGKSSILAYLASGENQPDPAPTRSFNNQDVKFKGVNFMIYDVSGGEKVRDLWKHYYEDALAIVWVVDASDPETFAESRAALEAALKDPQLKPDTPVLVAANKAGKPGAKSDAEITEALGLEKLFQGRDWTVKRTDAKTGEGIEDGFKWLSVETKKGYKNAKKAAKAEKK